MRTLSESPGAMEICTAADRLLAADVGRSGLSGCRYATTVVGVRSMTSNGSASVLPLWAPPIHGPSPGRAVQPPAPRARPRTMAVGRATGRSQLQIVKSFLQHGVADRHMTPHSSSKLQSQPG